MYHLYTNYYYLIFFCTISPHFSSLLLLTIKKRCREAKCYLSFFHRWANIPSVGCTTNCTSTYVKCKIQRLGILMLEGGQFFPSFLGVITTLTLKMNIELSSSTNIVDNLENIFRKNSIYKMILYHTFHTN